jgi:hypothetical protein
MKTLPFSDIKSIIARNMKNVNSLDEVLSSIVLESYQKGFQEGLDCAIKELVNNHIEELKGDNNVAK